MDRRDRILGEVSDLVRDLLVYDRRGDEYLPPGAIEQALLAGEVTVQEIVHEFSLVLQDGLSESLPRYDKR